MRRWSRPGGAAAYAMQGLQTTNGRVLDPLAEVEEGIRGCSREGGERVAIREEMKAPMTEKVGIFWEGSMRCGGQDPIKARAEGKVGATAATIWSYGCPELPAMLTWPRQSPWVPWPDRESRSHYRRDFPSGTIPTGNTRWR